MRASRVFLLAIASCVWASCAWSVALRAEPDVLERPALLSVTAPHALIESVVRAGRRLVAVGERGIVLLSDDNGGTWRQVPVPVSVTLTAVQFVDGENGWAVGHSGVVLRTTDGGAHWDKQLDGRQAADIVLRDAEAWAQGVDPKVAAGALRDAQRLKEDGPDKPFLSVLFRDLDHGLVIGAYGLFLRTDDGGRTWRSAQTQLDNPRGNHLYQAAMVGGRTAIAGEQGVFFLSNPEGDGFSRVVLPYTGSFFGVLNPAADALVAYGLRGHAYRSDDFGGHWSEVEIKSDSSFNGGCVADGVAYLLNQTGDVYYSRDGGRVWRRSSSFESPDALTSCVPADDGSLILAGMGGIVKVQIARLTQG